MIIFLKQFLEEDGLTHDSITPLEDVPSEYPSHNMTKKTFF